MRQAQHALSKVDVAVKIIDKKNLVRVAFPLDFPMIRLPIFEVLATTATSA